MFRGIVAVVLTVASLYVGVRPARAQGSPVLSVTVNGTVATASWTAVPGASGYVVSAGSAPGGVDLLRDFVVSSTAVSGALSTGTYYIRTAALVATTRGTPSNEVVVTIGNPAPAAPVGLTASVGGGLLTLTWSTPTAGGTPTDYVLQAGSAFGLSDLVPAVALGPLGTSWTYPLTALPDGTYFVRLYARNAQGLSPASSDAVFTTGAVPGVPIPLEATVHADNSVLLRWLPPAGGSSVTHYAIEAQYEDNRGLRTFLTDIPADTTSLLTSPVTAGGYYWRVRAYSGTTPGAVYGTAGFYVGVRPNPGPGPRAPNPAPGHRLPIPSYATRIVSDVAAANPADVLLSCVEAARYRGIPQGTNQFMFKVLHELRKYDSRWTLNWKRGNVGDLSQDIINYNFGSLPDEGTTDVYIIDIIAGHCGPRPGWTFIDQTEATARGGAIGRGTLVPYLSAGYPR